MDAFMIIQLLNAYYTWPSMFMFKFWLKVNFYLFSQQLKTTRDKIRQYQKRSEAQLAKDRELAKLLLQAHKKE